MCTDRVVDDEVDVVLIVLRGASAVSSSGETDFLTAARLVSRGLFPAEGRLPLEHIIDVLALHGRLFCG